MQNEKTKLFLNFKKAAYNIRNNSIKEKEVSITSFSFKL